MVTGNMHLSILTGELSLVLYYSFLVDFLYFAWGFELLVLIRDRYAESGFRALLGKKNSCDCCQWKLRVDVNNLNSLCLLVALAFPRWRGAGNISVRLVL